MTPTSRIEFFVWLLIAAAIIAMFAKRLRIPYTASLVVGGLLLGISRIPILSPLQPGHRPDWLTPDVILILFLPALVFEGSVKLNVRELLRNSVPVRTATAPIISQDPDKPRSTQPTSIRSIWNSMQEGLNALSPRARRVIARGSGHGVMIDRLDVVIRVIREISAAATTHEGVQHPFAPTAFEWR